jgi:two-component system, chemotaxis family, chemotaxis protein CheY
MTSILIVDDARSMRLILKEILVSAIPSVHVLEAVDSASAVKMYNQEKPDLVTMDINLPKIDGITCMKRILKINPHAKVVMISAIDQSNIMDKAINSGAIGYITKPFDFVSVGNKIKELLE